MIRPYAMSVALVILALPALDASAQRTKQDIERNPVARKASTDRAAAPGEKQLHVHSGAAPKSLRPANTGMFRGGAPVNDNCAGAINLTVGATCNPVTGNTAGATNSLAAISCNTFTGDADDDVWYKFTATATALTVRVDGSLDFDAVVDVRSGACNGTNIGCADATVEDGIEQVSLAGLTVGATYYVRVYDYYTGAAPTTDLTICVFGTPPPPSNDQCANVVAQNLTIGGTLTFTGSTAGATVTNDAVVGGDYDDATPKVWHRFTTSTCANVTLDYCGTTPLFDQIYIALATSCPADAGILGTFDFTTCVDGNGTVVFAQLPAGSYYVPVGQFGAGSTGPYTIELNATACAAPPANNECSGAQQLAVNTTCTPVTGDVAGATQSIAAITCATFTGDANDDVWYSFVATAASLTIEVDGSTGFDAVVDLRSGACTGTNLACADATVADGVETIQATGLSVGQTYYVRVYDYAAGFPATTTFTICVYGGGTAPANDQCQNIVPQALNVGGSLNFTGTTVGATTTNDAVPLSDMDDGIPKVWHAFTLSSCANVVVSYCNTTPAFDEIYIVWTDCPASTFNLGTFDFTTCVDGNGTVFFNALPAGTYYLPIGQFGAGTTGAYTVQVAATACAGVPANDDCGGATALTAGTTCQYVTGDVANATESLPALTCNGFTGDANDDVWFSFVATAAQLTVEVAGSDSLDAVMELFSGGCANPTSLGCADATLEGGVEVIQASGLTVGQTYHVRVYHYFTDIPATTTFDICVFGGGAAPANDNCSNVTPQALAVGGTVNFTGTTVGATTTGDAVPGSPMDDNVPKVWHAYTLSACADVTVSYCGTTPVFDQAYIVWTACPADTFYAGTFEFTTCADGNITIEFVNLQAGTYWLPVGQFGSGTTGPYTIAVSAVACVGPPSNNDCANAIGLPVWATTDCPQNSAQGNNVQATQDAGDPTCDTTTGSYLDMWYEFNSGPNNAVTITFNNVSMGDAVVVVYDGCNGAELSCDINPTAPYDVTVAPNTDHVVRVYSNTQFGGGGDFEICLSAAISTAVAESVVNGWTVFPNPTAGSVSVVWPTAASDARLELFDATGRVVWSDRRTLNTGMNLVRDGAEALMAGTYILRVSTDDAISEQRLVVQ
ncbi:MAG: T9SS type A sorting domain-containing protein [Flavobacteriales bacterium]|nr:T9SS type A sorting domain-containing protein [Flavobacteriales bacterium]